MPDPFPLSPARLRELADRWLALAELWEPLKSQDRESACEWQARQSAYRLCADELLRTLAAQAQRPTGAETEGGTR